MTTAVLIDEKIAPPSPDQSALGQTANWIFRPLDFMEQTQRELGDVFSVRVLGWSTLVLVSDPSLIKEIFAADPATLQTGKANDLMGPVVGRHSVFLLDGTEHRQVRRVLVNAFNLEAARIAAAFSAERVLEIATERSDDRFHDVHRFFGEIALATMLKAVFGITDRLIVKQYAQQFQLILGGLSTYLAYLRFLQKDFGPGSPGWWIRTKMGALHRMIEHDLAYAENTTPALQIRDSLEAMGLENATTIARDQIVSLIVAGHDTVASALSWSLYWLLEKPEIMEALRAEILSVSDFAAIEKAPLLDAVCLEALRLVPTVEIVSRQAMQDIQIGNYLISKGTLVSPCVYLLHRNEKLFPKPTEFMPERFMNRQFALHEYIPFGGGLRRCLGANLGLLEMKAVLVALLSNFDIEPFAIERVKPQRRNVTIAPSPSFRVRFKPQPSKR
jgi:cytochrome P450